MSTMSTKIYITRNVLSTGIAECELAEERDFRLPPEQWKAFLAILDQPAVANPALQRLLTEPSAIERAPRDSTDHT